MMWNSTQSINQSYDNIYNCSDVDILEGGNIYFENVLKFYFMNRVYSAASVAQMLVMVQRFLQRTEELNTELQLIDQHRCMLQEQLQNLTGVAAAVPKANRCVIERE